MKNPYSVIISIPRHQIVIQIVANLSSRLSRYNFAFNEQEAQCRVM